jgi:hypothetical protein
VRVGIRGADPAADLLRYARVYYGPRGGTVIVAITINIVAGLLGR